MSEALDKLRFNAVLNRAEELSPPRRKPVQEPRANQAPAPLANQAPALLANQVPTPPASQASTPRANSYTEILNKQFQKQQDPTNRSLSLSPKHKKQEYLRKKKINPWDIETGFNASKIPRGPFGARLGYLMALQGLIPHAARAKAQKKQQAEKKAKDRYNQAYQDTQAYRKQQLDAGLTNAEIQTKEKNRQYGLQLQKLNQPIIKMRKIYDGFGKIVGEKPIAINPSMLLQQQTRTTLN